MKPNIKSLKEVKGKARVALEASITHWEKNLEAKTPKDVSLGINHCALCRAFYASGDCSGCPVKLKTNHCQCRSSPYEVARTAYIEWSDIYVCRDSINFGSDLLTAKNRWREACKTEIEFLKGLRYD